MNAIEIEAALRKRYEGSEWAVFVQVPAYTGGLSRRVDMVVMNLWRSRGLAVHGFEFKCSRSDWLRELKDPSKADPLAQFCDFFWVVAGAKDIVNGHELPKGWGLMVPRGKGLGKKFQAEQNSLVVEPDRAFVAALLRKATNNTPRAEAFEEANRNSYGEGFEAGKKYSTPEQERLEHERLSKSVAAFEKASGLYLADYNGGRLGEQVKAISSLQNIKRILATKAEDFRSLAAQAERIEKEIGEAMKVKK